MRKPLIVTILTALIIIQAVTVYAEPLSGEKFIINGIDYYQTGSYSLTFGNNLVHMRQVTTDVPNFPLAEVWKSSEPIGHTHSQPVVFNDKWLFTLAGQSIWSIDLKTGKVIHHQKIQNNPTPSSSGITYFDGHLYCATRDGAVYQFSVDNNGYLMRKWVFQTPSGQRITSVPSFIEDTGHYKLNPSDPTRYYIVFGSYDQHIYILDRNGNQIVPTIGGNLLTQKGAVTSSPLSTIDTFLVGVDAGRGKDQGYLVGLKVATDANNRIVVTEDPTFNEKNIKSMIDASGIPSSQAATVYNGTTYVFSADKTGNFFCFNWDTGKLNWKYKYPGNNVFINHTPTVGDNGVVYFSLNRASDGKARIVGLHIESGEKVFEETLEAETKSSSTFVKTRVLWPLMRMYNLQYNIPIETQGAVFSIDDAGYMFALSAKEQTMNIGTFPSFYDPKTKRIVSKYKISNEMWGEVAFARGYLFVTDDDGYMHAFRGVEGDNLYVNDIKTYGLPLENGKTYESEVTVGNMSTSTDYYDVDLSLLFLDASMNEITRQVQRVDIPKDGTTTAKFTWKLDEDYNHDVLYLKAVMNLERDPKESLGARQYDTGPLVVEIDPYIDNSLIVKLERGQNNLYAENFEMPSNVIPGVEYTGRVKVGNATNADFKDVKVMFYVNDIPVEQQYVSLRGNESKYLTFDWTAPENNNAKGGKRYTIKAEINPPPREITEVTYADNIAQTDVIVQYTPPIPEDAPCTSWTERRRSGTDEDGNPTYKTVRFWACLETDLEINPDYRHGVYKAGYGIEAKVKTWIITNYDRSLSGAHQVTLYCDYGGGLEKIELEATKPTSNTSNEWYIDPREKKVNTNYDQDLLIVHEGKFYTDPHMRDGTYKITAAAIATIKGDRLTALDEEAYEIKGVMYDDDYVHFTQ